jgi:hypothetical protein
VLQGQGFENIGEQTFLYYGAWDPRGTGGPEVKRGGVGIALIERDRFADLRVDTSSEGPGDYQLPKVTAELVTAAFEAGKRSLFVNAAGLGAESILHVQALDELERPLEGFEAEIRESGFQTPIRWKTANALPERARLKIAFEGAKRTEIRLSAIYVR